MHDLEREQESEELLLAEFEHEEGEITIHLHPKPRALVLAVDGEEFARREVPSKYSDAVVTHVIEGAVAQWIEDEQPLDEIEYNLEQIEYQLRKFGRG